MELKVWCDGIQRIVCGATATTTCQDVVFALAHATGQTGRFILIEKWKHNERVLSPSDQPIISLSKWGEYANDVTFIMKKSGDVVSSKQNKVQTPKLGKKSDSDLMQKRKKANQENSFSQTAANQSMGMVQSQSSPMLSSIRGQQRFMAENNLPISQRILLKSSSQSQSVEERDFLSLRNHNKNDFYPAAGNNMFAEPLYGSLNKNRPRQPPPYKEAIAKSTLVNIMHNSNNFDHNYTVTGNIGSSQTYESPTDNLNNQQQVTMSHRNSLLQHQQTPLISSTLTNSDSLQQKTISLISIQQKTLKKQGKNMAELENEIDLVQRKLSENELIVNQYRDDMEFLKQKWIEQEMHIEKLESDNLEKELEKLINDGRHYETEMKEIRFKLSNCENEITKRREEIGILMNQIEDYLQLKPEEFDNMNHTTLIDRLKVSIQDKNNKIQTQKMDLDVLNDSIEHFDQTIQIKNSIVDKLIYQIKEANVEGLTLQSGANTPSEEKNCPTIDPTSLKSGTNRKIPVSLHELGNTVPTKKNPDGIWV